MNADFHIPIPKLKLGAMPTLVVGMLLIMVTNLFFSQPAFGKSPQSVTDATAKPNIIFILADDLGWAELGCYGNRFNETPHLDRLANQGVRFTDAYAAAPVCSPFRASLMTGQYPARIGITDYLRPNSPKHLSADHFTLAEMLRGAGYATGLIGKWHLSGYASAGAVEVGPQQHGFDEARVTASAGIGGYFHPYHFNPKIKQRMQSPSAEGREFLVDRMNQEAVEFIERHKDEPFFLFKSHYAVHTAMRGRPDLVKKYSAKEGAGKGSRAPKNNPHLAAQLESIDSGLGMIRAKLDELNLAENTIIIFMSDNGGESTVTSNAPLRAGKSTLYEGGIRVPLIAHWPSRFHASMSTSLPVTNMDIYPTLREIAVAKRDNSPQPLDGDSLFSVLQPKMENGVRVKRRDSDHALGERELYWHYPLEKPHFLGGRSSSAIRRGEWKLIEYLDTGRRELFRVTHDVGETKNLIKQEPATAAKLQAKLSAWRGSVGAKIPPGQQTRKPIF